jgi:hypothetical protein
VDAGCCAAGRVTFQSPHRNPEISNVTDSQIADLASQGFGLASALILYWQTFGVEWPQQTLHGTSPVEECIKRRQFNLGILGVVLAVIAFGCQTYKTVFLG